MKFGTKRAIAMAAMAVATLNSASAFAYGEKYVFGAEETTYSPNLPSSQVGQVLNATRAVFTAFGNYLHSEVGSTLPKQVSAGGGQLQGYSTSVSGPITLQVSNKGAITLSGMTIQINETVYSSHFVGPVKVGVTCNISETFPNANLSGTYNASTSTIGSLKFVSSSTPSQNVTCSDDLSGVPFLGSYIAGQAQQSASASVQQSISSDMGSMFALNNLTIPISPGMLYINGIDVGAFMKNNLQGIINGGGMTAQFALPPPDMTGMTANSKAVNNGGAVFTTKIFSISVQSQPALNLSLTEIDSYGVDDVPNCPPSGCVGSPN